MPSLIRQALVGALLTLAGVQAASLPSSNSSSTSAVCNNSPTLCGRAYSEITHMGAHDSAFLRDASTGNSIAGNQYLNATLALDAGLRLLQAQVHVQNNTLRLCHTTCGLLDAGPLDAWLAKINVWMRQHTSDVVTLLLVNSDTADAASFAAAFQSSGLAGLGYVPSAGRGDWPTLGAMIANDTRLVSFVTNIQASPAAPYLLPEFDYVFETPFTVTDLMGFNCTLDRPDGIGDARTATSSNFLGLANHFKDQAITSSILIPDVGALDIVNSAATTAEGNLGKHLSDCAAQWGRQPAFALVDFWNVGATVQAADNINGVKDASGRDTSSSSSSGGGGTATAGAGNANSAGGKGSMRNFEQGALILFVATALLML